MHCFIHLFYSCSKNECSFVDISVSESKAGGPGISDSVQEISMSVVTANDGGPSIVDGVQEISLSVVTAWVAVIADFVDIIRDIVNAL